MHKSLKAHGNNETGRKRKERKKQAFASVQLESKIDKESKRKGAISSGLI